MSSTPQGPLRIFYYVVFLAFLLTACGDFHGNGWTIVPPRSGESTNDYKVRCFQTQPERSHDWSDGVCYLWED